MIRLAWRGVWHHRALYLGVALGVAVTTALVIGGLAMGDVLRAALGARAAARVGPVGVVIEAEHGVRAALADEVGAGLGVASAPMLRFDAVASSEEGAARVQLLGVDGRLDQVAGVGLGGVQPGVLRLSAAAMAALGVEQGGRVVVRLERPGGLPGDSSLTREEGRVVAMALEVGPVWSAGWPEQLALDADPQAAPNGFVELGWLQQQVGWAGRANLIVVRADERVSLGSARWALVRSWRLQDAGLAVEAAGEELSLRAERVLLPDALREPVVEVSPGATPALTWFVDELRLGDRSAPYSFVSALPSARTPGAASAALMQRLPADLTDDEIVLTDWLAEDLGAAPGDVLTVRFPVLGRGREVGHEQALFTVRAVVPVDAISADAGWMPQIEGLSGRDSCRTWDPGLPVDLSLIRDRDEAWWQQHDGAAKAFITLEAGRRLWSNPHGSTTTVRYPAGVDAADLERRLLLRLRPEDNGILVRDLAAQLGATVAPANDFGVLFLGFQVVLIAAAMLLASLLLALTLQRREAEIGLLRAVGWRSRRVVALLVAEGALVVGGGVLLGVPAAWWVTVALVARLEQSWSVAIGGLPLRAVFLPGSVGLGALAAAVVSLVVVGWTTWRLAGAAPRDLLLRRGAEVEGAPAPRALWLALGLAVVGLGVVGLTPAERTPLAAGAYFAAGAALLGAGWALAWWGMNRRVEAVALSISALAWRAGLRRPRRALSVIALLSSGAFLVVGVGLGGGQPAPDATSVGGGSGGYAAYAEAVLPLGRAVGAEDDPKLAASRRWLAEAEIVSLRRLDGDDASCLQLGSARTPHLLGVDPAAWIERGAFRFSAAVPGEALDWTLLNDERPDGRVPAVGDVSTVTWGLHLGVGDVLTYLDEAGEPFEVEIVGLIGSSVFQGALIIGEQQFVRRYPSEGGYRTLLIDAPEDQLAGLIEALERDLVDVGLDIVSSEARLERFAAVEHTYVAIFHALGGLGLVLGAVGVGVVLARSVVERTAELALLRALGFSRPRIAGLLVAEHAALLFVGLGAGALAAAVAVVPVWSAPDAAPPVGMAAVVLGAAGAVGVLAVVLAAWWASAGVAVRGLLRE